MDPKWNEDLPIYRQLRDRVVAMILEGVIGDGDALPSVRNVASEYRLNPLTVLKGYQELVDEGLVEKKRGRGMFVTDGAQKQLLKDERQRFVNKEWPQVVATIERLGLEVDQSNLLISLALHHLWLKQTPGPYIDYRHGPQLEGDHTFSGNTHRDHRSRAYPVWPDGHQVSSDLSMT